MQYFINQKMQMGKGGENDLVEVEEIAVSDGGQARFAAVDVKSGEEKFNITWEEQGKLLRFDDGENQWKERGHGTAKILQKKDEPSLSMFVFRREGVGKIAAQHYLVSGMSAKLHPKNEKFVLWSAFKDTTDDEEGFPEKFILQMPSKELASKALTELNKAIGSSKV